MICEVVVIMGSDQQCVMSDNTYSPPPPHTHTEGSAGCPVLMTHSLTHACWHERQQQRYPTPVCSEPASEWSPRCDGGSWTPLLQFDARCSWVTLVSASPLASREELYSRCCLAFLSSHVQSISMAFACWWYPCCLSRARIFVGFFSVRFLVWKMDS